MSTLNADITSAAESEEGLQAPFDIALAPPTLGTQDAPLQQTALASALRAPDDIQDNGEGFSELRPTGLPLHRLQGWYKGGQSAAAIDALFGRKTVTYVNGHYTVKAHDGRFFWAMDKSYLDLLICVGKGLGLGPLLPKSQFRHTYRFRIDLQKPMRQFTAKYVKLGFDPTGTMLWIGRSAYSEDVWLAFPPKTFCEGGEYDEDQAMQFRGSRSTTLSSRHYRCAVIFLARMLLHSGFSDITVNGDYPSVVDDIDYRFATNLQ